MAAVLVQLVTLPNGRRLRAYWQGGRLIGQVQVRPEDRTRPDGTYRLGTNPAVLIPIKGAS
jgi:hypothetical protein